MPPVAEWEQGHTQEGADGDKDPPLEIPRKRLFTHSLLVSLFSDSVNYISIALLM